MLLGNSRNAYCPPFDVCNYSVQLGKVINSFIYIRNNRKMPLNILLRVVKLYIFLKKKTGLKHHICTKGVTPKINVSLQ